jgi:hypothetical protein
VVEWNPNRRRSGVAWRPLTVAQNGAALAPHEAAAHRLQIGETQWLSYRSLSRIIEPRTVLGYHTMCETVIGRFVPGGNVEPIMLIEQSAPSEST